METQTATFHPRPLKPVVVPDIRSPYAGALGATRNSPGQALCSAGHGWAVTGPRQLAFLGASHMFGAASPWEHSRAMERSWDPSAQGPAASVPRRETSGA